MTAESSTDQAVHSQPLLITATELAGMMQISIRTLWRLRSAGELLEPVRIGGNTRWRLDEVHKWINDGCPKPNQNQQ